MLRHNITGTLSFYIAYHNLIIYVTLGLYMNFSEGYWI